MTITRSRIIRMVDNKWMSKAIEVATMVKAKNEAYGSSFDNAGKLLRVLYPDGVPVEQLDTALTLVRMFDKMFRLANQPDAFGESPWDDLVGYSLLAAVKKDADNFAKVLLDPPHEDK
jgi:hypothetical protein